MQEGGTYKPLRDAAEWAAVHLDRGRADKLILVARRLEELPEINAALSDGEVHWSKVREIARVATPATERKWLDLARTATSREVEEAVARAKRGDEPGEGLKARRPRYVEKIVFSGEEKATWDQTIRKIRSELPRGATPARAAAEMARRALLSEPSGEVPGGKARDGSAFVVVLHRGKDGSAWADATEGRVEVDPSTVDEKVREGARVIEVRDIEGAGECEAIRFGERGGCTQGGTRAAGLAGAEGGRRIPRRAMSRVREPGGPDSPPPRFPRRWRIERDGEARHAVHPVPRQCP
jgi:hypothetical protein